MNKSYARCTACNSKFYPLQIKDDFESMCKVCILKSEDNIDFFDDEEFIQGFIADKGDMNAL